jgi:hypothetical protein
VLLTADGATVNVTAANAPWPKTASHVNTTERRMRKGFIDLIVGGFNNTIVLTGKAKSPLAA